MPQQENIPRFYVPSLSPGEVTFPDDEAHHALKVLRLRVGAPVELFDGRGGKAVGEILRAGRNDVTAAVGEVQRTQPSQPRVHVAFAVPKAGRLDWLLEKATELAAGSLQPIVFERSVAGGEELTDAKRNRWEAHCVAAGKQSGLDWLPEIRDMQPLKEFLARDREGLCLAGDIGSEVSPLREVLRDSPPSTDVTLLIGPEGGFTEAEREAIRRGGFRAVRLGETTLRIETAAAALLAGVRAIGG
ncbi:MAG: 16S rRNA (uracil(1498)-N(3))-methyltransferase [Phycisphaerae bacterium]|nr:16S rRNA (uracil(1498)-N(3))-methyltransferase [Phycisphaerae bacterium]